MRKYIASLMSVSMALTAMITPYESIRASDDNTNAAEQKIALLEAKTQVVRASHCLPPEGTENQQEWFELNPMSPECFKMVVELEELYRDLEKEHHEQATELLQQESNVCQVGVPDEPIANATNLQDIQAVTEKSACTQERKEEIARTCGDGLLCVFASTGASTLLGPAGALMANAAMPDSFKAQGCNAKQDDCTKQLVLGFAKSVWGLLEGVWDVLKMAGKGIANKATSFWDWVTDAEKNSSTAQLAAAKASEDEGIFHMLATDFSGTMAKLWSALVAALKEWLSSNVFCQEWEGVPQFSKCKRPAVSAECLECKAMLTGLCVISGTILAEIVPAFLTGGIAAAVKYGAGAAAKLAKLIKVTSVALKIIREAPLVVKIMRPAAKVVKVLKLAEIAGVTFKVLKATVSLVAAHLLSPAVRALKYSFNVMRVVAKSAHTYVMLTRAGPVITFGLKAAKISGKVIIFPFDNAMTTKAFEVGEKTFEKVFSKMASAKVLGGMAPVLAGEAARLMSKIDQASIELQVARYLAKKGSPALAEAEKKYLTVMRANRKMVVDGVLGARADWPLSKIIEELYPELKYTENFVPSDIRKAELELFDALAKVTSDSDKARLMQEYQHWVASKARAEIMSRAPAGPQLERSALVSQLNKTKTITFEQIIEEHYPELLYQNLGKQLGPEELIKSEQELLASINKIEDASVRNAMLEKYKAHTSSRLRDNVVNMDAQFTPENVIRNASLNDTKRVEQSFSLLGIAPDHPNAQNIRQAILDAHNVALTEGGAVYNYTFTQISEKVAILEEAGLDADQIDLLIRSGLAGRPPLREIVKATGSFFEGHAASILQKDFKKRTDEVRELLERSIEEKFKKQGLITRILNGKEKALARAQAAQINENLDALYFIDYKDTQKPFLEMLYQKKEVGSLQLYNTYERKAFDNYQDARKFLSTESPPISEDTLLAIHKQMMKGGIEDVPADALGKIRDGSWAGNVPPGSEISDEVVQVINDNPYLMWMGRTRANGKNTGLIYYPNARMVKDEALLLIKDSHPDVYKLVKDFKSNGVGSEAEVTRRLVEALTEERIDRFNKLRAKLGKLNTPEKLEEYVDSLADLQRDLVSIHPLANGNGRSTREFALYYLLSKEGLPPPRIIDPNADIYFSQEGWRKVVKHGVLASDQMVEDLAERLRFNLPLENSLELFSPYTRPGVSVPLKAQGSKIVSSARGVEYIDPRVYREIIKRNPRLQLELQTDPVGAWDQIHQEATEVFQKNNTYYRHNKNGLERLELGFVDDDFVLMYGRNTFSEPEAYNFKMKTWYEEDITWRGLASKTEEKTEAEIIDMFKQFDTHMASNSVLSQLPANATPEQIRVAALADFKQYNDDVFGDGLIKMAKDHSETGPLYGRSYGYSTSKNREVGKAFSMGAMVVGKYGEQRAPELQAMLKSRILVGARRARKDVDLGRLKQLREGFSYKYGRQQEVMGIGAAEPDAMSIVQSIDAHGDVIVSYLRNPEIPSQIWVVKGDIRPGKTPAQKDILKIIDLTK